MSIKRHVFAWIVGLVIYFIAFILGAILGDLVNLTSIFLPKMIDSESMDRLHYIGQIFT